MHKVKYSGQLVFGLDIGTRSIVGTVGYKDNNTFYVVSQYVKEHETRAMLDGQIHDINKVGESISIVKKELEEDLGRPLDQVCIAAAGRVLRTITTHVSYEFPEDTTVNKEYIYSLDMLGVEKAHDELAKQNNTNIKFYCVGYSVIKYYLNDYVIGNLEHHKAKTISADIIATFLPEEVVDGLYKAVEIAGLSVANLTLEPIAAIEVAIPSAYRMLNIALVDVGAGTSDICLTKDGSITAYGMIPAAGDKITEKIAAHCLLDFQNAEKIKTTFSKKKAVAYKDILGVSHKTSKEELYDVVNPVIKSITDQVAEKIIELNGDKAVSAVFVVGGGGKLKGFTEMLAEALHLDKDRVALRGEEVLTQVEYMDEDVKKDSTLVTPIGICLNFYEQNNSFIFVQFNEKRVKLYDNSKLTIMDVAMQIGYPYEDLFPKRGKELHFKVNGKTRMIRGEIGEAATISLNGDMASINSKIESNDKITIVPSTAGQPAACSVRELPEFKDSIRFLVNDKPIICAKFAEVNHKLQSGYYEIQNNDEINMLDYYTVSQIIEFMDIELHEDTTVFVNNKEASLDEKVYENFSVQFQIKQQEMYYQTDAEASKKLPEDIKIPDNTEADKLKISVTVNEQAVQLTGKTDYVLVDIFAKIDFDRENPKGSAIVTLLNGEKAQYLTPIQQGDKIDVYWE